jgi:hypothetical protein
LRKVEVELSTVIQQAIEVARPLLDSAEHDLRVILPDDPIYLDADPARLAQVFGNLLNNSSRYTKPGGTISSSSITTRVSLSIPKRLAYKLGLWRSTNSWDFHGGPLGWTKTQPLRASPAFCFALATRATYRKETLAAF